MTLTIQLPNSLMTSLRNLPEQAQSERLEPVVRAAVQAALQAAQQAEESATVETAMGDGEQGILATSAQAAMPPNRLREIIQAARQAA